VPSLAGYRLQKLAYRSTPRRSEGTRSVGDRVTDEVSIRGRTGRRAPPDVAHIAGPNDRRLRGRMTACLRDGCAPPRVSNALPDARSELQPQLLKNFSQEGEPDDTQPPSSRRHARRTRLDRGGYQRRKPSPMEHRSHPKSVKLKVADGPSTVICYRWPVNASDRPLSPQTVGPIFEKKMCTMRPGDPDRA
jgi:hypothetical protein